jgi:DNA-binding LacI/PurR family transcriptional regulator
MPLSSRIVAERRPADWRANRDTHVRKNHANVSRSTLLATLKDVALKAGVSVATASLALNGKSVNENTRKRVVEWAEKLSYSPHRGGRTLITGKSHTILFAVINSTRYANLIDENTFFYHYIMGILKESQQREYHLHLEVKNWQEKNLSEFFAHKVNDKSTDGMIIIPQYMRDCSFLACLGDLPAVFLNPFNRHESMSYVSVEHEYGGTLAANHLIERGYRRIALINGPEDHYDAVLRRTGALARLERAGIRVPRRMQFESDFTVDSGYSGARAIIDNNAVDAIICANDYVASGAMRYVREIGRSVPDDIAIIGYDNVEISRSVYPQLTTIGAKLNDVGSSMARSLFQLIEKGGHPIKKFIRPELIVREST